VDVKRVLAATTLAIVVLLGAFRGDALAASARPLSPASLRFPAAFAVTPHGARILYGELHTGRIRWLDTSTGASATFFTVPNLATAGEQGVLGVALSRSYPNDRRVWVYVTRSVSGTVKNQLLRIQGDGSGFAVLRSFPAAPYHDGGRIMFGPDGRLYVVVGDNENQWNAQDLGSLAGKMLRLNPDGTVPSDNPRPSSPIIGYGIRNSFGFAFDPRSGRLWETENGPACNDEINLVARLRLENFGWGPSQSCSSPPLAPYNTNQDGPSPVMPKHFFRVPPALTGAAFCRRCDLAGAGQLFFGDYNTGTIHRATLNSARTGIVSQAPFYDHPNSVLSLETPLDGGPIYFSTPSNILRLKP
jgi:glucose/arabinose dehydrogenase